MKFFRQIAVENRFLHSAAVLLPAFLLAFVSAGCLTGPDYERPEAAVPEDWRWKTAEPSDHVPRGEWWRVFDDANLSELQRRAVERNQDLKAAAARVEQARATARVSRSDFYPSITASPAYSRYRTSGNAPSPLGFPIESFTAQQWDMPFDLSYELDVWGKVRRSFESARELAIGAEAARQTVLLTLQADVAVNYFSLVGVKAEIEALEKAIELRNEALGIFQQRLQAGVGTEFEVERTKVELATARADLAAAERRRAELENALAVLCGTPPSEFQITASDLLKDPPAVAPGLPSELLERRPDVAEAERRMAAANARIGAAKAALFPSIRLTANGGFQSGELSDLFQWESRVWGISPSIFVPIFQGERLRADLERVRAEYEESVAAYRQQILTAFREVDDSLAAIRHLDDQLTARREAVVAATNSSRIAMDRFTAGTVNFLEVVDAESARLQNELSQIRAATEQLAATVRLIKALGGGWDEPSSES